jgi:hypothetical protein
MAVAPAATFDESAVYEMSSTLPSTGLGEEVAVAEAGAGNAPGLVSAPTDAAPIVNSPSDSAATVTNEIPNRLVFLIVPGVAEGRLEDNRDQYKYLPLLL